MAAQSEAASVKGSPFSGRLLRAVLYSTSRWLASWSFLLSARFHGSTRCNLGSSLRNRGARGPAGKYSFNQLPIPDDRHAVHHHKINPFIVSKRIFIGSSVDNTITLLHG